MRILLLGATGRTGKLVLQEALANGHTLNCIVRNLPSQKADGATYYIGNPDDENILRRALEGCEAIISVLNISRTSDFPWARLRTPKTFLSDTMLKLFALAFEKNITRIIVCSAWGVAETNPDIPGWFKWFIDNSNIGVAYRDHALQEKLLQQSSLNWTIVRPTGLINTAAPQKISESYQNQPRPGLTISRMSVAKYLVAALTNDTLIGKKPVISGKKL